MLRITNVDVKELHNIFTYNLNFSRGDGLAVLYGDNGSGKTTLLNLIFHLLSSRPQSGHLTYISKVPFQSISVELSDGTNVTARRKGLVDGFPLIFSVTKPDGGTVEYHFVPTDLRERVLREEILEQESRLNEPGAGERSSRYAVIRHRLGLAAGLDERYSELAHSKYFEALQSLNLSVYLMGADRRVVNDSIEIDRPRRVQEIDASHERISATRIAYLNEALSRASRYLAKQIINASNLGTKNTEAIYAEIVDRLSSMPPDDHLDQAREIVEQLIKLSEESKKFSKYGLIPELNVNSILLSFSSAKAGALPMIARTVEPYIASSRARLNALKPILIIIQIFVTSLNDYLKYKSISYLPAKGFQIKGLKNNVLEVFQLSSGEQQLLLIFFSLLAASEENCIFMIDEPEISLNVKWQRDLIRSLRQVMSPETSQLVIATHSIELLTQHSQAVAPLIPKINLDKDYVSEHTQEAD